MTTGTIGTSSEDYLYSNFSALFPRPSLFSTNKLVPNQLEVRIPLCSIIFLTQTNVCRKENQTNQSQASATYAGKAKGTLSAEFIR